ncbi:MAG: PIN domain-containing protein [Patulibacter sp.]
MSDLALLDASAFWRLGHADLGVQRRDDLRRRFARGALAASTMLLLETRAGRQAPAADAAALPLLWITERAEQRAAALELQMRGASQQLGVPPIDYLIAAVAEAHGAALLHYDRDFERIAAHTDLAAPLEPLAPLGSLD